jgi:Zn finger protein HypA/HybF involved in hydrogenase expression
VSKTTNYLYIFDCLDCGHFYGEQSLTPDGRLLCPSCYSQQSIDADWVERVEVKSEVEPFTAGILCEDCAEPINRDGFETYCYKCDPSFGQV